MQMPLSRDNQTAPAFVTSRFKDARILIVDDEAANVDVLRRLLERHGYARVESTNDPRQAAAKYL